MNQQNPKTKYAIGKINFFLTKLKQFWIIILAASIIGGVLGGVIVSITYSPIYTVTQTFTIKLKDHPDANQTVLKDSQLAKTIPSLMSSEVFMDYISKYLSEQKVSGRFKVTSLENSNIFYLTVESSSNENAKVFIDVIEEHYPEITDKIIGESEMKLFAEPSTSNLPSNSPNYLLGILLGAIAVFAISILCLMLNTSVTKTVFETADAEKELNAECLAVIHESKTKQSTKNKRKGNIMPLIVSDDASLQLKKSIEELTQKTITKCSKNGYKTILVTSTISGEGKSSTSLNLACNLADLGHKVAIVDCDFRAPSIHTHISVNDEYANLYDVINNKASIKDAIAKTEVPNLYYLGNNDTDDKASENASSNKLIKLIESIKSDFDYIILDTPPVGFLGDGLKISEGADCFIYVVSHNYTNIHYVKRSLESFNGSSAKMLGFVINHKH